LTQPQPQTVPTEEEPLPPPPHPRNPNAALEEGLRNQRARLRGIGRRR